VGGIADRVRWQLDGWLRTARLKSGVSLVRLWPEEVVDGRSLQLELFAGGGATAADDERAGRALLRVQSLLGPEGVSTPLLDGGRGPAQRVNTVAWGDERVARFGPELPWPGQLLRPSPSTVLAEPAPIRVVDARSEPVALTERYRLTAPPVHAVVNGTLRAVLGWAGPWTIDRQPSMAGGSLRLARMQILLEKSAGELALLLRTSGDRWLVEGIYD
jgi:protein ImuB